MDAWIVFALRVGGLFQLAIVSMNGPAVRIFDYATNLSGSSRIFRQIFWAHVGWVIVTMVSFAAIDLVFPEVVAGGAPLGTFLAGVLTLLWSARLFAQLAVYDREVRRLHRGADVAITLAFVYLVLVHGLALARGLGAW
jgi:uncharacterized membrane protein YhaH (DUF805 family)